MYQEFGQGTFLCTNEEGFPQNSQVFQWWEKQTRRSNTTTRKQIQILWIHVAKENVRNPAWTADYNGLGFTLLFYMLRILDEAFRNQVQDEWIQDSRGVMARKRSRWLKTTWKVRVKLDIDIYLATQNQMVRKGGKEGTEERRDRCCKRSELRIDAWLTFTKSTDNYGQAEGIPRLYTATTNSVDYKDRTSIPREELVPWTEELVYDGRREREWARSVRASPMDQRDWNRYGLRRNL